MVISAVAQYLNGLFVVQDKSTPLPPSAGIWSFITTGLIAAVVVVLAVLMVRTVRRINYRAQIQEELQHELALTAKETETSIENAGEAA